MYPTNEGITKRENRQLDKLIHKANIHQLHELQIKISSILAEKQQGWYINEER